MLAKSKKDLRLAHSNPEHATCDSMNREVVNRKRQPMHAYQRATEHGRRNSLPNRRIQRITKISRSNLIVVKVEGNIARAKTVGPHKLGIARRTLVLGIASQHALNAETNTLDILHRRPSLRCE